jgi:pimeloyl-ACP methyl ester carboxylesterase
MLAGLGYEVWAPNLRGYGNSARPPALSDYAIEALMADVAGLIDASNCRDVVLIAHDWGGVIAWYFAMRQIRPLEKLIVLAAPHPGPALRALRHPAQLRKSWYVLFFQLPGLPEWVLRRDAGQLIQQSALFPDRFTEKDLEIYRENARRPGAATAMIHYYRAMVRGGGARRQQKLGYPIIETPTLLLYGEKDVALGLETIQGSEEVVRDLTLRVLPRVSHWIQQDVPDVTNAMIAAFLKEERVPELRWEAALD